MLLHPAPTSTANFTYDPSRKLFIGEISATLGLGRVYDDSCDEGLTLHSHRTGKEVVFVVQDQHVENGDLTHWTLRSTCGTYSMTLFND